MAAALGTAENTTQKHLPTLWVGSLRCSGIHPSYIRTSFFSFVAFCHRKCAQTAPSYPTAGLLFLGVPLSCGGILAMREHSFLCHRSP